MLKYYLNFKFLFSPHDAGKCLVKKYNISSVNSNYGKILYFFDSLSLLTLV